MASSTQRTTGPAECHPDQRHDPRPGRLTDELNRYPPTPQSEALIHANVKLACKVAWGYFRKTSGAVAYDDLQALAYIGLIKACRSFDPARGNKLSTIAYPFIHGEILHHFRDAAYTISFPMRWREAWGKARRLLADPAMTPAAVAEACKLQGPEELAEMLSAMTGTHELNDETQGRYLDPEHEVDLLAPVLPLVRKAWEALPDHDAGLILQWWQSPRRRAFPSLAMVQFLSRARKLLDGRRLAEYRQTALPLQVEPAVLPIKRRPRRSIRQIHETVIQMGLGSILPDHGNMA